MESLHKKMPLLTKFQILPNHIQVINDKWEGIYSWIAVNYMLNRFSNSVSIDQTTTKTSRDMKTVGRFFWKFIHFFNLAKLFRND